MIEAVTDAEPTSIAGYDDIIDVRSPAEFDEDHMPGAINLPVLDDAQRAEIGTIYVQKSKFLARRLGAAMVSRNIANHLTGPLADKPGGYRPLIYCWRGGQRSTAMATVLSQVGWRTGLLHGGYRTYRRRVTGALYDGRAALNIVLLCGGTGTGKTALLHLLQERGVQALDLEALAGHRGSLFGVVGPAAQPSQKMFESRLLAAIDRLDAARPVVVEAESSRIGRIFLPPSLWDAMARAAKVEVQAPVSARARHIVETYTDIAADPAVLSSTLESLPRHHSKALRETWRNLADDGRLMDLATQLIDAHYDPAYQRSSLAGGGDVVQRLSLSEVSPKDLARAADAIATTIRSW